MTPRDLLDMQESAAEQTVPERHLRIVDATDAGELYIPTELELETETRDLPGARLPNLTVSERMTELLRESRLFARLVVPINPTLQWNRRSVAIIDRHLVGREPVTLMFEDHIESNFVITDTAPTTYLKALQFTWAVAGLFHSPVVLDTDFIVEMRRRRYTRE